MKKALVLLLVVAALQGCAPGALGPGLLGKGIVDYTRGLEPQRYLAAALDLMQQEEYYDGRIDWAALRREAFQQASGAWTPSGTYPAIEAAIARLHAVDNHSDFQPPGALIGLLGFDTSFSGDGLTVIVRSGVVFQVLRGGAADRAGVRVGDVVESIDGRPVEEAANGQQLLYPTKRTTLLIRHPDGQTSTYELEPAPQDLNLAPTGRQIGNLGYVNEPSFIGFNPLDSAGPRYASTVAGLIQSQDQAGSCGWIVDLRQNYGGNVGPMSDGLSAFLGTDPYAFVQSRQSRDALAASEAARPLKHAHPPVAVLIGPPTGSSGELVAIAFRGRSEWRSFGEPSYGATSGNQVQLLRDGAVLTVMTGLDVDRTGMTYGGKLLPDVSVAIDWSRYNAPDDPVIAAAAAWLRTQAGCS